MNSRVFFLIYFKHPTHLIPTNYSVADRATYSQHPKKDSKHVFLAQSQLVLYGSDVVIAAAFQKQSRFNCHKNV